VAAGALALMPRVFYHAHLDCFDVPVMTMWVAVLYCYWRSLSGGVVWALATGVMWGLALETKHNAWFVPILVVVHQLATRSGEMAQSLRRGSLPVPLSLVCMAVLGPLLFWALWPWMWFDTLHNPGGGPGRCQSMSIFTSTTRTTTWSTWGITGFARRFRAATRGA
jgi:4-amino-4-deoxy-L-arabinose transferase-like glycosyltransferase